MQIASSVRLLTLFILLTATVNALNFTVASYNVENLFDLESDGTEYKEYKPNSKYWKQKNLSIKLNNISKTIKDLDADIIALQEIESNKALELLHKKLPSYKYSYFLKNRSSSIGVGVLSRYKIIRTSKILIDKFDRYARPILETTFSIDNKKFTIYNNHWRSKRAGENTRIKYAMALKNHIFDLNTDKDYILLGDFNSDYNEWLTFKSQRKLNNTYGITGINHILNTTIDNKIVTKDLISDFSQRVHYNLWLELEKKNRFSTIFRNQKGTPDNILVSPALFDNYNISYVNNSFKVFKPKYLYSNNKINRWKKTKGYSDHLPIVATFSTTKQTDNLSKKVKEITSTIQYLYDVEHISEPINIKNLIVIYSFNKGSILKQKNGRAIYAYRYTDDLIIGNQYNVTIDKLQLYNGLLEIKELSNIKQINSYSNYKDLYLDASKINIFDVKYTNDIITNLIGVYKKRYLHFITNQGKNHKIRLYLPKRFNYIKENDNITIISGHLSIYKGQIQIDIHKKSDIIHND